MPLKRPIAVALPLLALAWPALAQAPAASLKAPDKVEQSTRFEVTYSGPLAEGDQIQIAWPRTPPATYIRNVLVAADGTPRQMTAPGEQGTYELRYYSAAADAVLASRPIEVVRATIAIDAPESVGQGTPFQIAWRGPAAPKDRIEIVRGGGLLGTDTVVAATNLRKDGKPVVLEAPIDQGGYELRYVTGEDGEIAAKRTLRVVAVRVSLKPADSIVAGSRFEVRWEGPAAERDEIRLFPADGDAGDALEAAPVWSPERPVVLSAPLEPGRYRLAYWSGKAARALADVAIRVEAEATEARVEGPRQVEGGSRFEVTWTGPGAPFDEIELSRPEMRPGEHVSSTLVPPKGVAAVLDAPVAPGVYELRYWSGRGRTVLAQRQIRVGTPAVSLKVAGPVRAGGIVSVDWRGPAGQGDELRITPLTGGAAAALHRALLETAGQPARLRAPATPGTYQLRYWSGSARSVLASAILTVE